MKKIITFMLVLYTGISAVKAQQYYCQPYYGDNKLRFYTTTNPVAASPFYTLDLSADVNNAWGENASGPNDVVIYNNKVFVSFDLGDRGGVLIYNLSDIYPTRTTKAPIVLKPQTTNGLSTAGIAINPANGDLFVATFFDGTDDAGVYQYTAASGYATASQFASYYNDSSVAQVCANLAFDTGGNLWMTTWEENDNANAHFLICYKGLNKNNYYKITNTATASYSAKDVNGTTHNSLNLLSAPEGIAFDPSGNLFLANNNDFALTNPAGEGTFVKLNASWLTTLLASPTTGSSAGNPTYTVPAAQASIMYIAGGKPGGLTFNSNTLYINDQGQNQGSSYTSSGTVWQWDVTTAFNTTDFKASGIHTTYPGNGGGAFVTLQSTANATLSALKLSKGTLMPVFAAGTTSYTASVGNGVTSITETPTASAATSTIKVNGATVASGTASASLPLTVGANTVTTVVTANDGVTTKTYKVIVTRAASSNAKLSGLKTNDGALTPAFTSTTTSYTKSVANTVTYITFTPTTADAGASVTVKGTATASGTASAHITLNVGANVVPIVVTAQDGVTKITYTVTVTRAASSNASLSALAISRGTLTPAFATGTTVYTDAVANNITSLTVTPKTSDPTATVKVNGATVTSGTASGPISLVVGPNTITTEITAQNGSTTKSYKITVTRAASSNAKLLSLTTSKGALTPAFNTTVTSYTKSVSNSVTSITFKPTVADNTATVTVNGTATASGTTSAAQPLAVGNNTEAIKVTAQDGTTTMTYTVTVTRAEGAANPVFETISVEKPTSSPQFNNDGISVHQGLSPNGDGVNDFLLIEGITHYPDNKLMIMNRSGQLVYEAKGYDNSTKVFDGHSNKTGAMQLPGTYFYSLDYAVNGITKHKTGFIVLKY